VGVVPDVAWRLFCPRRAAAMRALYSAELIGTDSARSSVSSGLVGGSADSIASSSA
jgi:hypothetical protein